MSGAERGHASGLKPHVVPFLPIPNRKPHRPRSRARNKKTGNGFRRAGWRSFGEYIFLEDSRYASQQENPRVPGAAQHLKGVYARP
jgi:hypothetical protein